MNDTGEDIEWIHMYFCKILSTIGGRQYIDFGRFSDIGGVMINDSA